MDLKLLDTKGAVEFLAGLGVTGKGGEGDVLCLNTLAKWRCLGCGPCFLKIRGAIYYRAADLEAWVAQHTPRRITSALNIEAV